MDTAALSREVDLNYDYFQRNLATLMRDHGGEYAVLRSEKIIAFFRTVGEAYRSAVESFPDRIFSIQEVTDEPVHLGVFSHVAHDEH